jgi:hypothetical protein
MPIVSAGYHAEAVTVMSWKSWPRWCAGTWPAGYVALESHAHDFGCLHSTACASDLMLTCVYFDTL